MSEGDDKARFGEALAALGVAFGREVDEPLLRAYWLALADLGAEAMLRACHQALRSCDRFPVPSELRRLAAGGPGGAAAAWALVVKAIRAHGAYESVRFEDPAITAAIRQLGGWVRLCCLESHELHAFVAKDFARTYEALATVPLTDELTAPLRGLHEMTNRGDYPALLIGGDGSTSRPRALPEAEEGPARGNLRMLVGGLAEAMKAPEGKQ